MLIIKATVYKLFLLHPKLNNKINVTIAFAIYTRLMNYSVIQQRRFQYSVAM